MIGKLYRTNDRSMNKKLEAKWVEENVEFHTT